jgi:hypothetical protein
MEYPEISDLISDPLFQLNALLWMAQPLPKEAAAVAPLPILHESGFTVYAIAPALAPPPDVRQRASAARVEMQDGARPDVVLRNSAEEKYLLVECKKSSFGPDSDNSRQARTLLLLSGPYAAKSLGLSENVLLSYLMPESETNLQRATLLFLQKHLRDAGLPAGDFSTLGLTIAKSYIALVPDRGSSLFVGLQESPLPFMRIESQTDPRCLYFIPYDPDVGGDTYALRAFYERILSTVVAAVGHASAPGDLVLETERMLNSAMFGVYHLWRNRDSSRCLRRICKQFMKKLSETINSQQENVLEFVSNLGWRIHITDAVHKGRILDKLCRFSCETLAVEGEPAPDLLDSLE